MVLVFAAWLAIGCAPQLDPACDMAEARRIAYAPDQTPAFTGQAIVITSCAGGGAFCHADGARARYGAPFGMNFDPVLADQSRFADRAQGADHLFAAQHLTHQFRADIWAQVVSGAMPPGGIGSRAESAPYLTYADASDVLGSPVPSVRSAEGREILRNWLACGSPVVEATTGQYQTCANDSTCPRRHHCLENGLCENVGTTVAAYFLTSPTWPSIYATVISRACTSSLCHSAENAPLAGHLDLSTMGGAYAALVDTASSIDGCGRRVVSSDPDASLLMQKLTGAQSDHCGDAMPIGGALGQNQVDAIRTWISQGATATP